MKRKLLFFHFDLGNGGAERVLVNLANSLDPDEYDITVKTLYNYGVNRDLFHGNIRREWVLDTAPKRGVNKLLTLFSPRFLHSLFIRERYDIEIAYLEGSAARIVSGCPDSSTRLYAWIHVEITDVSKYFKSFRNLNEASSSYHKFNKVACVSNQTRQSFIEKTGWNDIEVDVVHNVLDINEILSKSSDDIPIRLSTAVLNICSVGRLNHQKGYDRLLKALGTLKSRGMDNWHLYLLGQGEELGDLTDIVDQMDISDNVSFLGYIQKPYHYVSKMDLYVCSSLFEGYSTSVSEAVLLNVPVIATKCSGMDEILGEDYAGIVENSENGIFSGLKRVFEEKQFFTSLADSIGKRSKALLNGAWLEEFESFIR